MSWAVPGCPQQLSPRGEREASLEQLVLRWAWGDWAGAKGRLCPLHMTVRDKCAAFLGPAAQGSSKGRILPEVGNTSLCKPPPPEIVTGSSLCWGRHSTATGEGTGHRASEGKAQVKLQGG